MTLAWVHKGNIETESAQIAEKTQRHEDRYVEAKIDNTQQDKECGLFSDGEETTNQMTSECS